MIGSLLTRVLLLVVGYIYPAYDCYKAIENNGVSNDQLKIWCKYWIIIALFVVFESVGGAFISWLPFYGEAQIVFVLFLWHPKTRGSDYVYNTFVRVYIAKHENEIDMQLEKIKSESVKMTAVGLQKLVVLGQSRLFEVMQYITTQSARRPKQE